jgi:vitamin B12 transporter
MTSFFGRRGRSFGSSYRAGGIRLRGFEAHPHRLTGGALAACGAALFALAAPGAAQTLPLQRFESVVVTGNRTPQRLGEVMADLQLIGREDIERQGWGNLADLLRAFGVGELVRSGTPASPTSVFIRGADSRHTVVLIDGVRFDSQATGGAAWQSLPLSQIDRVEVLKGPASAVYGSDAVAGVIQIFTRKGQARPEVELAAAAGSMGTRRLQAQASGRWGGLDIAAGLAEERSRGFDATTPANTYSHVPDTDGWAQRSGSLRMGLEAARGHRLEVSALSARTDSQFDSDSSKPTADDRADLDAKSLSGRWSAQWHPHWHSEVSLAEGRDRYASRQLGVAKPDAPYQTQTRIRSLTALTRYAPNAFSQWNALLERREDALDNPGLNAAGQDQRRQDALGLTWMQKWGELRLQAQARHDRDSQFGGVDTGSLALGYRFSPQWSLHASKGNAFRAPTLFQRASLYGPDLSRPGVKPLQAEQADNQEATLRYLGAAFSLGLTHYDNRIEQLIVFGPAGSCRYQWGCYANVDKAQLKGSTLSADATWAGLQWQGQMDWASPTDASSGKTLPRRAQQRGVLRVQSNDSGTWAWGLEWQASGRRWDNAANTRALAGYGLINAHAQWRMSPQWKLQLNLDNALNRSYTLANGYRTAGRAALLGLRYTPR